MLDVVEFVVHVGLQRRDLVPKSTELLENPAAVAAITEQVRFRVLRWFARSELIERDDVREMRAPRYLPGPTAVSRSMPRRVSAGSRRPGAAAAPARGHQKHPIHARLCDHYATQPESA